MAKIFHLADDNEIKELLLSKDSINTKQSTAATVKFSRQFVVEKQVYNFSCFTI